MTDIESALDMIFFTGRLTNPDGTPAPDGAYNINLNIFTEPVGGEAIWSQWMDSVMVRKGIFRVPVEKKTLPSDYILKGVAYLEVQIGKQPAEARQKLDSAAFDTNSAPEFAVPILGTDAAFSYLSEIVPDQRLPTRDELIVSSVAGRLSVGPNTCGIAQSNGYLYVITMEGGFQVIDVHDPTRPTIVGSLTHPPSAAGPIRVVASGNFAFVLENYNNPEIPGSDSGLLVIDVSQPTYPVLVSNWRYETMTYQLAVSSDRAVVTSLSGSLEVFALEKGYYPVHSGQIVPGRGCPDVVLAGNYAYVAIGGYESLRSGSQFFVVDISNAKQPTVVGTTTLNSPFAFRVCVADRYAYVTGGQDENNVGQVIDISNPAQPVVVGVWNVVGIPGSIQVLGRYLYTIDMNVGILGIVDISNPNSPIPYDFDLHEPTGGRLYGVVSEGYAYLLFSNTEMLQIIRLPEPNEDSNLVKK
jgi:hypothetical protein